MTAILDRVKAGKKPQQPTSGLPKLRHYHAEREVGF